MKLKQSYRGIDCLESQQEENSAKTNANFSGRHKTYVQNPKITINQASCATKNDQKILTNNPVWHHPVIHLQPVFQEGYSKATEIIYTGFSN